MDHGYINELKVSTPVAFALKSARGLCLESVTLINSFGDGQLNQHCPQRMEVRTGPQATGPWTSVVAFTSAQTTAPQTFAVAPGAPVLAGFVQVVVLDTYGKAAEVKSLALQGTAWGPAA